MNFRLLTSAIVLAAGLAHAAYEPAKITPGTGPRGNLERTFFYSLHETDGEKGLPRVLLVGDRVAREAYSDVQKALRGRAVVTVWDSSYDLNRPEFDALLDIYLRTHDYAAVYLCNGVETALKPEAFATELSRVVRDIRAVQPESTKVIRAAVPSACTAETIVADLSRILPKEGMAVAPEPRTDRPTCTDYAFPIHPAIGGRENIEWSTFYSFHETDAQKDLPRVLMVGDSITQSYYEEVARQLRGKAIVSVWVNSYNSLRPEYQAKLRVFLRTQKYAIVHYNISRHCYPSDADWEKGLRLSLKMIRAEQPQAKLIWANGPLPRDRKPGVKGRYHELGCKVVGEVGVDGTNDIYALSQKLTPDMYHDEVHFEKAAQKMAADQAVAAILPLLPRAVPPDRLTSPAKLGREASGRTYSGTTLSGGRVLPPFKVGADGIWRTPLPGGRKFDELWVNGRRAVLARTPDEGKYFHAIRPAYEAEDPHHPGRMIDVDRRGALTDVREPVPRGATMVLLHGWDTDWGRVYHVNPETGLLILDRPTCRGFFFWPKWAARFAFENYRAALDAPGEWFVENEELLYVPRPGETVGKTVAVVPTAEKLLTVDGAENLVFEGMTFEGSGYRVPESLFTRQAAYNLDAAITLRNVRNVTFRNCRFTRMAAHAVWIGENCRGVKLTNCRFDDIGAGALFIGPRQQQPAATETRDIEVSDSIVSGTGRRFPEGTGIMATYVSDCRILRNEIADIGYTGVSCGYVWGFAPQANRGNVIAYNRIHHLGRGTMSDMAGIYTLGDNRGTRIFGNWISDLVSYDYTGSGGEGLYADEGSRGELFESNVVLRVKGGAINQNYGRDNVFRGNILAFPGEAFFTQHSHRSGTNLSATVEGNVCVSDEPFGVLRRGTVFTNALEGVVARDNVRLTGAAFKSFDRSPWNFREVPPERVHVDSVPPIVVPPRVQSVGSYSTSFETKAAGQPIPSFFNFSGAGGQDLVRVTDREHRHGSKCLCATDDPARTPGYLPHFYVKVPGRATNRVTRIAFSFKAEPEAVVDYACRDWPDVAKPFASGLVLRLTSYPAGVWYDVEIVYTSHAGAKTEIAVKVTDEHGKVVRNDKVRPDGAAYVRPTWAGFLSSAKERCSWYLDDFTMSIGESSL